MNAAFNLFADDEELQRRLAVLLEAKGAALGPEERLRIDRAAGRAVTRCGHRFRCRAGQGDGAVVLGVVVVTVAGDVDDGGGRDSDPARGAGAGAGSGAGTSGVGSLATGALAALVGGVTMAGREGGAVVGTAFVSGCSGPLSSLRTAIIDAKPTRNAATHASGITTARPPILAKNERRPSSSSATSIDAL
jgi:hypothetical protein